MADETQKVKVEGLLYEHTSKEYFNVPMFRLVGQENSFVIINNLDQQKIMLPTQSLNTLIVQLMLYRDKLQEYTKSKNIVIVDEEENEE
jgi:hypothetical protein